MEEMHAWLPYATAVISALVSGLCSYAAARKQSNSSMRELKEANEHELEKLMRQHEVNLDSLKASHALEIEKLEIKHQHELEMANSRTQNEITTSLMSSIFAGAMDSVSVKEAIDEMIASSIRSNKAPD